MILLKGEYILKQGKHNGYELIVTSLFRVLVRKGRKITEITHKLNAPVSERKH